MSRWDIVSLTLTRGEKLTLRPWLQVLLVEKEHTEDADFMDDGMSPGNLRTEDGLFITLGDKGGGGGGVAAQLVDDPVVITVAVMVGTVGSKS